MRPEASSEHKSRFNGHRTSRAPLTLGEYTFEYERLRKLGSSRSLVFETNRVASGQLGSSGMRWGTPTRKEAECVAVSNHSPFQPICWDAHRGDCYANVSQCRRGRFGTRQSTNEPDQKPVTENELKTIVGGAALKSQLAEP